MFISVVVSESDAYKWLEAGNTPSPSKSANLINLSACLTGLK